MPPTVPGNGYEADTNDDALTVPGEPVATVASPPVRDSILEGLLSKDTPEDARKSRDVSESLGIPSEVMDNAIVQEDYKSLLNEGEGKIAPSTMSWMRDSEYNTKIAQEDVGSLSFSEHLARKLGALSGGVLQVFGDTAEGLAEVNNIAGRSITDIVTKGIGVVDPELAEAYKQAVRKPVVPWFLHPTLTVDRAGEGLSALANTAKPQDPTFVEEVFGGVGQLGSQIAIFLATGGTASVTSLYGQGVSIMSDRVEETGVDGDWNDTAKIMGGAVTSITEKYGIDILLKRIPASFRTKLVQVVMSGGTEAAQEIMESVGQKLVVLGLVDPDHQVVDLEEIEREGLVAGTVGAVAGLAIPGRKKAIEKKKIADAANETLNTTKIKDVDNEANVELKTRVLREAGIEQVYVDLAAMVEHGKTPEGSALFNAHAVSEAVAQTVEEGGSKVALDVGNFARHVFGTGAYNKLSDYTTYDVRQPTPKEAVSEIVDNQKEVLEKVEGLQDETLRQRTKKFVGKFQKGETVQLEDILLQAPNDVVTIVDKLVSEVKEDKAKTETEVRAARQAFIQERLSSIDTEIDNINSEIGARTEAGRGTKRLEKRVEKLVDESNSLNEELADIQPAPPFVQKVLETYPDLRPPTKGPVITKAERLRELNVKATADTVRGIRKGFRVAKSAAKKDTEQAQTILSTMIKDSDLSRENKAKYLSSITSANTTEKLEKALPDIQQRVMADIDRQRKAQLKGAIEKVVKRAKPKKQAGKPVSNVTPAVADFIQDAESILKMPKAEAKAALEQAMADPNPDPVRNMLLGLKADIKSVSATDIENLLTDISDLVDGGRAITKANRLYRLVEAENLRREVNEAIGDQVAKVPSKGREIFRDKISSFWRGWNGAWHNKLQHIFQSKDAEKVNDLLKRLSLFDESRAYEKSFREQTEKLTKLMTDRLGMTERQLLKQWQKDSTDLIDMGFFHDANGQRVHLKQTKAQIRKKLMEFENPEIAEQLFDKEAGAWTLGMKEALEAEINDFDKATMEAQLEFYADYYDGINQVYRRLYGVNLPQIDNYIPIRRDFGDGNEGQEFFKSLIYRGGVVPGGLKTRQTTRQRIRTQGDIQTMNSHLLEMEYFKAYAEKVNLLNRVFTGDANSLINRIQDLYGEAAARTIKADLDWFTNRGSQAAFAGEKVLNQIIRNFGFAQLGAKPQIGLKQLASFSAFSNDVKTTDFVAGVTRFFTHNREARSILNKSSFYVERGLNLDNDFRELREDALGNKWLNFMGRHPTFTRMMMMPIRYGDKGAIAIGGYAHIYAKMKQGATLEQATDSFGRLATKTQQSADPDQVSELQRGNAFMRVFGQFMSSANAITRAELEALGEFRKGRISKQEFAKRMIVYHFLIPNTIQFLANGLSFEEEDHLRASIIGSFNGLIAFGDAIELLAGAFTGAEDPFLVRGRHPFELANDVILAADQIKDITMGENIDAYKTLEHTLEAGGALTGIPLETLFQMLHGIDQFAEGEDREGSMLMLGYSPYIIEKTEK